MDLIKRAYIAAKTRAITFRESFKYDERGVSAIVATLLILLIVVLMAAVFWDTISEWFSEIMDKIFDTAKVDDFSEEGLR